MLARVFGYYNPYRGLTDGATMDEFVLSEDELPEPLRAWLATAPEGAFALALERLGGGRLLLRPLPEASPELLARLRVTIAKYHEALMNLS
jgi:hypothetical protein